FRSSRLPSQSTEDFPNHHLAECQTPSNSAIADALGLEKQNRTIAWGGLGYRTICGSFLRADQGTQSSRMQALLETTQGSCGVTERACQIVLIGVSGFVQRNQGIGFGGAIFPGVVRVDDAMDKNDALVPFGLEGNAFIDEHHLRNRGEVGKEIACMRIRVHGRIGCPGFPEKKSGDRKSTRLNSSHGSISYAVFC